METPSRRRRSMPVALEPAALAELFRAQSVLSVKDALGIIHEAQELLQAEPNTVRVEASEGIYVFGDIHGQFFDLLALVEGVGLDKLATQDIRMVFLGDYVDRGAFSCEVMLYLLLLKLRFPHKVVLLRGNHECETLSSFYGFRQECRVKYGLSVYYHFVACFQALPLAALLASPNATHRPILCVHGGLSPEIRRLEDIDAIDRHREVPMAGPLCDLLWADPSESGSDPRGDQWTTNSVRGCSYYFGAAALFAFLEANALLCVVRAHEYEENGFLYHFNTDDYDALDTRDDRSVPPLITVFSAANYCDTNRNKAGYLIVHSDPLRLEVRQAEAVDHPIPGLVSVERSADLWRQFRQTLPFLPASKDFFEDVLFLSGKKRDTERNRSFSTPQTMAFVQHMEARGAGGGLLAQSDSDVISDASARRKRTSEMHPQAIRRVLDEEAARWMQTDEDNVDLAVYPTTAKPPSDADRKIATNNSQYRVMSLQPPEVDTLKLIFSLLDTDGSMTLNASEVALFVFNILGERITPEVAEVYLDALDFDRNGTVDLGDILSWAAVMKANHARRNESVLSLSYIMRRTRSLLRKTDPYRGFLWLSVLYIVRDVVVLKRTRLLRSKSLVSLVTVALVLYTMDVVRICRELRLNRWCELFPLWQLIARMRRNGVSDDQDE